MKIFNISKINLIVVLE